MSLFQRYRWFVAAAGITLAFAAVSLIAHKSPGLTAFADLAGLVLMIVALGIALANAAARPRKECSFWVLMALGFALWVANQTAWTLLEVIQHREIPDPFLFDIVLFFHTVPMIAAIAWRPDLKSKEGRVLLSLLNFLMLFGWWIFLYAFIVFPHQYVALNVTKYNVYYDHLYGLENALLVGVLVLASLTSSGGWRRLYLHFLGASILYAINSQLLDRAAAASTYDSGSLYDAALVGTVAWIAAAALSSRDWELQSTDFNLSRRWRKARPPPCHARDPVSAGPGALDRVARPFSCVGPRLPCFCRAGCNVDIGFVFLRQYLQDQALMSLLKESRRAYESQEQLQNQLVQKEKLASLGNLIAGAAHEIDHPLNAVMTYSELLWSNERLSEEQNSLVRKIVNQARRTRDLVANLLSFAQQAPGEKKPVDIGILLSRATQMLESRKQAGKIQARLSIAQDFPPVYGNANQLFQAFVKIIENAIDALTESGGGLLEISAQRQADEVVLEFSDNGPGIRDPQRVFDPFYTTKPVGKGTGLGLSAVYGVVQDHGGQITCRNRPEGGALFVVRLPASAEPVAQSAGASG